MRGIVIYDSTYGNTKAISTAIADGLKESGVGADLVYVKDVKHINEIGYDFLIAGSPTKCGTMSFTMKRFLGRLKEKIWKDKPFAAYDTENPENIVICETQHKNYSAAEKIAIRLRDKQLRQMLPVFKARISGWKGPLLRGETERARAYARVIAADLKGERIYAGKSPALAAG